MKTVVKLGEALAPLAEALGRLRESAKSYRSFVIASDLVTNRFVQFSGSDVEPLLFDAPQLGIVNTGRKFEDPDLAARYALEMLRGPHRLPDEAEIEILFDPNKMPQS